MTATEVEIAVRLHAEDEVEFVEDLDEVAGGDVLRGCGDDNPYN
jgi:hypothetical protein